MSLSMFCQITKVDEQRREVIGRAAQEVVDRSDEIFDYETSKPHFEAWSKAFAEDTDGKSLGNLRAMHGKVAAGKLTGIDFNDAEKAIDVKAKVVDDAEWKKVLEGVYTGFSIGGSYVGERTTEKLDDGREVRRYTAKPSEISLVDSPCIPTAKFFDVIKADGATEQVAFKEPALEPAPLDVVGTDEEVAAFAKALNDANLTLSDAIAAIKAEAAKRAPPADPAPEPVAKGMWNAAEFARLLDGLACVARSAQMDADLEGDASPVPAKLRGALGALVAVYKELTAEEADELLADLSEDAAEPEADDALEAAAKVGALQKRLADPDLKADELLKLAADHDEPVGDVATLRERIVAKAAAGHVECLQQAHDLIASVGAKCAKEAATPTDDLVKAHAAEMEKVTAKLEAALERIKRLESQPMPYVTLRTVAKAQAPDAAPSGPAAVSKSDYVYNPDGSVDWLATQIMATRRAKPE